jgi:hypothetical protein
VFGPEGGKVGCGERREAGPPGRVQPKAEREGDRGLGRFWGFFFFFQNLLKLQILLKV